MKPLILLLFLCLLASCGGTGSKSNSGAEAPGTDIYQALEEVSCPNADDFRGSGVGNSESEALAQARSNMALEHFSQKLKSDVQISGRNIDGVASTNTATSIDQKAALTNAQDARIAHKKQSGNKIGIVVCMSKADAAKPYIQRQSLLLDSLEFITASGLKATHPKQKNETRNKANAIWARMFANNGLLKSWGMESDISRAKDLHDAVEYDYKDYCQTAKLHWNPERETPYSEIVFSKLSGSVKMEKSPCNGRGISLVYKGTEPSCSVKFGLNTCDYAQSLSVSACDGTEYLQLKSDVMGAHQKPDFALEKLQGNLKSAEFWSQWMQEIKQWSPQCE
jgi:hypothetical protein